MTLVRICTDLRRYLGGQGGHKIKENNDRVQVLEVSRSIYHVTESRVPLRKTRCDVMPKLHQRVGQRIWLPYCSPNFSIFTVWPENPAT